MSLIVDPGKTDLKGLEAEDLEDQITGFSSNLNAATCRWLLLIAEFDRREGYQRWECKGTAEWLSQRCGVDTVTARQHLRVANRLSGLLRITEAFLLGHLSYSQVRAMTRVATQNNEEELLHMALQLTASQLERLVRGYRGVLNNLSDEDSSDRHSSRSMRTHYDDDGAVVIVIKLPPEQAELLMKAVDEEEHRLMLAERKRDPDESPLGRLARRADALVNLVESSTKVLRGSRSGSERNMVVVHVDEQTLSGGTEGVCETGSGSAITPATARRLSCDASVQKVTIDTNGRMVKVSSAQRTPPSWMRRQLRHRDVTCEFPGCDEERFLDAHHITHWADGGPTHLDNLIQLCWFHHHKVHDARWEVTREQDG